MILKEPYEFRTLKLVNLNNTILNINRYIAIDYMYIKQKEKVKIKTFIENDIILNPVILYGLSDIEKEIPSFSHPIINTDNKWIALDLRQYVKASKDNESYDIKNEAEYNLAIHRFILTALWYIGKQETLYSLKLGHFAFASWISENLTRKFGLDLNNQLQLRVLALIYYSHLFTNKFEEEDLHKLIIRSKTDSLVPNIIEEVNSKVSSLENINDFGKACYEVTGNIRLKDLDFSVLINVFSNNWLSSTGKELSLLSLEHPPTWLSLVYAALTNQSFKKNFISIVVERLDKKGKGEEFIKELFSISHNYLKE